MQFIEIMVNTMQSQYRYLKSLPREITMRMNIVREAKCSKDSVRNINILISGNEEKIAKKTIKEQTLKILRLPCPEN